MKLKVMVDLVNHYTAGRDSFERIRLQATPVGGINELQADLETWAEKVRRNIPELAIEIEDLLVEIKNYLDT